MDGLVRVKIEKEEEEGEKMDGLVRVKEEEEEEKMDGLVRVKIEKEEEEGEKMDGLVRVKEEEEEDIKVMKNVEEIVEEIVEDVEEDVEEDNEEVARRKCIKCKSRFISFRQPIYRNANLCSSCGYERFVRTPNRELKRRKKQYKKVVDMMLP